MSWQPNWQGDARGGIRRGRAGSEEGEEVEESGELKPIETRKREDGEMEEEGEIPIVPPASVPVRSVSAGHVDFPGQFRGGRGPANPRFGAGRDRPRPRNSFSGMPSPRVAPAGGGFPASGSGNGPPFQRDGLPPPPLPASFRGGDRDLVAVQPPRGPGARDFRDFSGGGPPSSGSGPRADSGPPFGGSRDFRNDPPPPLNRDFSDGPSNRPSPRDFRSSGPTPPPGRDFRNDRDYRDRSDGPPPPIRDFRGANQPPFPRDRGNPVSLHREPSFGPGPRDASFRDAQPPFRDGPKRDGQFLDGPPRDFRDVGPRESPFRDSILPDRGSFGSREMSGGIRDSNNNRGAGMAFPPRGPLNRETSHGGYNRDAPFDDGREEQPPLQRTISAGMMPNVNTGGLPPAFSPAVPKSAIIPGAVPPHMLRPTDPRRRASVGASPGAFGAKPDVPSSDPRLSTAPPLVAGGPPFNSVPAPHPTRRMSSYSSLADGSSVPSSLAPKGPPQSGEGPGLDPNDRAGGPHRSPIPPRRTMLDPTTQHESGEYYPGLQRHSLLSSERGRPLNNGPPNAVRAMHQQQPPPSPSRLPHAPPIRPSNIRTNDPRFRQQERGQGEEMVGRSNQGIPNAPQIGVSSMDTFGRSRDWKDRPFGSRPGGSTPRSSPIKQKIIRPFSASPQGEKHVASFPSFPEKVRVQPAAKGPFASTADGSTKPKTEPVLPLSTQLLGDHEVVKRAKGAMEHLLEVVPVRSKGSAGNDDGSVLPTKQVIMSAVTEIEKLIKESQRNSENLVEKKQAVLGDEEKEREEEADRLAEEKLQQNLEQERLAGEEKRQEEGRRAVGLKKALEEREGLVSKAKAQLDNEFRKNLLQARDDERMRFTADMEGQIAQASSNFDKDIAKSKRDLEKMKAAVKKAESKVTSAESEYQSLLQSEDKKGKMNEPSTEPISQMSHLIQSINANNRRYSSEAHNFAFVLAADRSPVSSEVEASMKAATDPKYCRTNEEWSDLTAQVSSIDEALYSDPSEAPYYDHNEKMHVIAGPSVKEFVRDRQQRLLDQWNQLAEEYEVRRRLYEKQQKKLAKRGQQRSSVSLAGRSSILGDSIAKETTGIERGNNIMESTGRTSNNPYRRARRGNEVRSEYEQEQIIAEIAAKEAMEKRISHGGCKLPRQICRLERVSGLFRSDHLFLTSSILTNSRSTNSQQVTASYVETFTAQKIDDPVAEEQKASSSNIWTDMEKCIFLDRFLQFPKDFRRIATFLRNKTTKDCVAFYYNSKQAVPYKGALKEHMMRRKRKGDYQIWDSSIQAAISVGAVVSAGSSEEKPVIFSLPSSDRTYVTRMLHPLNRKVLDAMKVGNSLADFEDEDLQADDTKPKSKKRNRDPLFSLDKEHTKFLRMASQESMAGNKARLASGVDGKNATKGGYAETGPAISGRKAPQKWTATEKRIFVETLEEHGKYPTPPLKQSPFCLAHTRSGRDWARLSKAVGTKSISQIKNYYYDYKKQSGKYRGSGKKLTKDIILKDKTSERLDDDSQDHDLKYDELAGGTEVPGGQLAKGNGVLQHDVSPGTEMEMLKIARETGNFTAQRNEQIDTASEAGNRDLLQHLLNQQLQQQQLGHQQQLQLNQHPQTALQQLLTQHHHQRDHHQPLRQLSLEDTHRLLQHQQSQSHQQHVVSNLLPWLTASQLLQTQSRIQHAQAAAALHQQESAPLSSVSDIADGTYFLMDKERCTYTVPLILIPL